jgi:hypothetical protein
MQYGVLYIPAPPGKLLHHCNSVDVMWRGKQMIYVYCSKLRGHKDETEHYDAGRKYAWEAPIMYWDEFDRTRSTKAGAVKVAKKVRLCKICTKPIKTDGSPDSCVCKPTGRQGKQGTMFKEDRERIERELQAVDLAEDIALTEAAWHEVEIQAEREAIMEHM